MPAAPASPGRITFISPKAEFTPRNVQTAEDRSKLVYRVKVGVDNTDGMLKSGMPVEAGSAVSSHERHRPRSAWRKRFGTTTAVKDVSLTVERGEMFGLIGPDGAGKTTTIRMICGLLHADAGRVRVLGLDPVSEHRALTQIGRLPVAALQPVRRSQHRREHRVLRRDPRRARLPARNATGCSI